MSDKQDDSNEAGNEPKTQHSKLAPPGWSSTKNYNTSPTLDGPATWPGGPVLLHNNVTLLECINETILTEALAATDLKYAVVRRISPTAILVDTAQVEDLFKALTKRGYEPKRTPKA